MFNPIEIFTKLDSVLLVNQMLVCNYVVYLVEIVFSLCTDVIRFKTKDKFHEINVKKLFYANTMDELDKFFDFSKPFKQEKVSCGSTGGKIKVEPKKFSQPGEIQPRNLDKTTKYAQHFESDLNKDMIKVSENKFNIEQ